MNVNKQLTYRGGIIAVLIITVALLLSGNDFLLMRVKILFNFHLATALAWLGLTACSLLAISINLNNKRLAFISSVSFYLSIFWLLISYLLAGNNNLIFAATRIAAFYIWMIISSMPVLVLLVSFFYNTSWKLINGMKQK